MKSANGVPFEYILAVFKAGESADETTFHFCDEERYVERYLGYLPDGPCLNEPYWAGHCDIEDGFCCASANELFKAQIYNGRSLKERWRDVFIETIGMIPLDDFQRIYHDEFPVEKYCRE